MVLQFARLPLRRLGLRNNEGSVMSGSKRGPHCLAVHDSGLLFKPELHIGTLEVLGRRETVIRLLCSSSNMSTVTKSPFLLAELLTVLFNWPILDRRLNLGCEDCWDPGSNLKISNNSVSLEDFINKMIERL